MPNYTIWRLDPDPCDYPDCLEVAVCEVGVDGSPVSHRYTCKRHAQWGGEDAVKRHVERAERLGIPVEWDTRPQEVR